jgi:hypothetical protein
MCKFQDRQARHIRVLDVLDGYSKEFLYIMLRLPWEDWPPDFQEVLPFDLVNYLGLDPSDLVGGDRDPLP